MMQRRYFGTLCGSTILQSYLLSRGISKAVAFWLTIALGSVVNYMVLTYLNAVEKKPGPGSDIAVSSDEKYGGKLAMVTIWRAEKSRLNARDIINILASSDVLSRCDHLVV